MGRIEPFCPNCDNSICIGIPVTQTDEQQVSQAFARIAQDERTRVTFLLNYESPESDWHDQPTESNGLKALVNAALGPRNTSPPLSSTPTSPTSPNQPHSNEPYGEIQLHFMRFHKIDLGMSWNEVRACFEGVFRRKMPLGDGCLNSRLYRDNVIPCRHLNGDIMWIPVRNHKTKEVELDPETNQPILKVLMKKWLIRKKTVPDAIFWADFTNGLISMCPDAVLSYDWPTITEKHREKAMSFLKAHDGKRLPGAYWEDRIFEDYRPIEERALHRMADIAILSTKSEHTMEQILEYRRSKNIIPHVPDGTSDVEHEYSPVYNPRDFDESGRFLRQPHICIEEE